MNELALLEISSVDWSEYDEAYGRATEVGPALRALIEARDVETASLAWDKIEEHVFSQGDIYSVAEPTVSVVLAALMATQPFSIGRLLDLLLFIVQGASSTDSDLQRRVRFRAREGLWLLIHLALTTKEWRRDCVLDVIDVIAPERAGHVRSAIAAHDRENP